MIPLSAMFIYLGVNLNSLQQIIEGEYTLGPAYICVLVIGGIIIVALTYWIVMASKKELTKILI